jgi:hypothetical protein
MLISFDLGVKLNFATEPPGALAHNAYLRPCRVVWPHNVQYGKCRRSHHTDASDRPRSKRLTRPSVSGLREVGHVETMRARPSFHSNGACIDARSRSCCGATGRQYCVAMTGPSKTDPPTRKPPDLAIRTGLSREERVI